ncbi:BlaI/MecI/CopY family transcriptional regulator [Agromyces aerolatus]|uniref:BlaI/MecI/CopY family transcriptional regulator n=1 Tax=Agromyces sp. LY-1074 TaxID=3074080 RepID=UPI00286248EB|nr:MULTISPECIES: BlaI/MecI/CopY family transcriptional regulator [unclassified Agromyces]MDR5700746.1 BlaI/MecI/CopY family transcriptional regulator [Agromyces sp. LY-1074]MDR5707267.1 BlaI/MecI/CopY family transcriptional regulator [Agromyces sp. LY-1358]
MANLGDLERSVMEQLWASDTTLTANELRDRLTLVGDAGDRSPATTTVLTVLARLERKGFVSRTRDVRPHRYRALLSREEHTAELMHEVLDRSSDRDAALARFVGTATAHETATLRRLLDELARR